MKTTWTMRLVGSVEGLGIRGFSVYLPVPKGEGGSE